MSGKITLTTSMTHLNDKLSLPIASETTQIVQSASGVVSDTPTISTSGTALTIQSRVTTLGIAWVMNLDGTNFVDVGTWDGAVFSPFMRLLPGERYPVRLTPGITLRAKADSADVQIQITIYEA